MDDSDNRHSGVPGIDRWVHEGPADFSVSGIHSHALRLRKRLVEEGKVSFQPGNRFDRMIAAIEAIDVAIKAEGPEGERARSDFVTAMHTLWQATMIADAAFSTYPGKRMISSGDLQTLARGPWEDGRGKASREWNHRNELYAGSNLILAQAGITRAEPDWRMQYHDETIGLAVKQLNGQPDGIGKLLGKASRQIELTGLRGLAMVNIERLTDDIPVGLSSSEYGREFRRRMQNVERKISQIEKPSLLGTILYGTNTHWVRGQGDYSFAITSPWEVRLISEVETEERAMEFFDQHLKPRQRDYHKRIMDIFTGKRVGDY